MRFRKHSAFARSGRRRDAEPPLTGAMVVLSALVNCSFGYSPGATEMTALPFG
jgi:hypothetical protein